ncbi:MAG: polysaccharide deacetylase family protein [Clostridia bacterium]|nr:polysaccharide deacetylase family protein [Clostridia bacterium]
MKKSQFITIFIMLVVASVLICIGCFLDNPKGEPEATPTPSSPVELLPTVKPTDSTYNEDDSPTPTAEAATPTPDATAVPTEAPTEVPTEEPGWPDIPFPVIKNLDFVQYDNSFDYFSTKWVTDSNQQNKAEIYSSVISKLKDVDYVFYTIDSDTEWAHYMTFTLHYEYGYTAEMLDLFKDKGIKAVFFVTQKYIADNPNLVRRMKDEGHIIGNRGIIGDSNIKKLTPETFAEGLLAVEQEYQKLFGPLERMYLFRTDYFSNRLLKVAEAMGYTVVFRTYTYYSKDTEPFKEQSPAKLAEWFMARGGYNGSVAEYTNDKKCLDALKLFIPNCIDQGITFKLIERRH